MNDPGVVWAMGMSYEFGQKTFSGTPVIFDGDDSRSIIIDGKVVIEDDATSRWNRINFPGWHRQGGGDRVRALYDDLYVATGANARARVELGDNKYYDRCKRIDILIPENWSEDSISATVRLGAFEGKLDTENVYLFVIDSMGNPSTGYFVSEDKEEIYAGDGSGSGCFVQ